jgi:hypothetical protein
MTGVPYFHPAYNMSPSRAGKMLMSTARSHGKAKGKSKSKAVAKAAAAPEKK